MNDENVPTELSDLDKRLAALEDAVGPADSATVEVNPSSCSESLRDEKVLTRFRAEFYATFVHLDQVRPSPRTSHSATSS